MGIKDKNNREIHHGNIVRFYFDADIGLFRGSHKSTERKNYTKMIDVATVIEGVLYFFSDIGVGAFASRFNEYCEIIGKLPENKGLLADGFYENLLEKGFCYAN